MKMKVYHRLVGDPPARGFDDSLMSPGFPVTAALAGIKNARISVSGVPWEIKPDAQATGLTEQHRVYEVQSIAFGQVIAVHSAVGSKGQARAHAYTDFVLAKGREGALFTDEMSAAQWLRFDGFINLEQFWALDKSIRVLQTSEWVLPEQADFEWDRPLSAGFRQSLLARYWCAASRLAFKGRADALRVCLGQETDCNSIIRSAKAFFAQVVLSGLPLAVNNIMSMSVPVPQQQIMQKFPDSALIILYPEENMSCDYDLRLKSFTPIGDEEAGMIADLLEGRSCALLEDMLSRWQLQNGGAKRESCSLMADYDIALALFRLHKRLVKADEMPALWQELDERLSKGHGLSPDAADSILADAEQRLLGGMLDTPETPTFRPEESRLLLHKALRAGEALFSSETELLKRQQNQRQGPFITELLLEKGLVKADNAPRAAQLLAAVLEHGFLEQFPDDACRGLMAEVNFAGLCQEHLVIREAMVAYVHRVLERHPKKIFNMLPLSILYLDKNEVLGKALRLLCEDYVVRLPEEDKCLAISALRQHMDETNLASLREYTLNLLKQHTKALEGPAQVCQWIGADMSGTLKDFFSSAGMDNALLKVPFSPEQMKQLLDSTLMSLAQNRDAVLGSARNYVDCVLAKARETGSDRFGWLTSCAGISNLLPSDFLADRATGHLIGYCAKAGKLPEESAFQTMLGWLQAEVKALEKHEQSLKDLYAEMGDRGGEQLIRLIPLLKDSSTPEQVRGAAMGLIASRFTRGCGREGFWLAVEAQREPMARAKMGAGELLRATAEAAEKALAKSLGTLDCLADFEQEHECRKAQKEDNLKKLWQEKLAEAFAQKYDQLFLNECLDLASAQKLKSLGETLQVGKQLEQVHGAKCLDALLKAANTIAVRIPALYGDSMRACVRDTVSSLLSLNKAEDDRVYRQMRKVLRDSHLRQPGGREMLRALGFHRQLASGLICCAKENEELQVEPLLDLMLQGDVKAIKVPCAPQNLNTLAGICAMFEELSQYSPTYAARLCNHLLVNEGMKDYSQRLRQDKKGLKRFFPWLARESGPGEAGKAPEALRRWLEG